MLAIGLVGPAIAGPGNGNGNANPNSEATITVEWVEDEETGACTDFTVTSSKDISFVSVNYSNFEYEKFDGLSGTTFEYDEEEAPEGSTIKSIVVKSGTTTLVFECGQSTSTDDTPECSDDQDNDGDGTANHPGGGQVDDLPFDDGCETPDDNDECPNGTDTCPPEEDPCADQGGDTDGDEVCDDVDNCPDDSNPGQEDSDGDGIGDACDTEGPPGDPSCSDGFDNDGDDLVDGDDPDCQEDPCPDPENPDSDGDGVCDNEDNCPDVENPGQEDSDGDGIGDACDTEGPPGDPSCSDGFDNDGDDLVDGDDPDCQQTGGDLTCRARVISIDAGNDGADLSIIESNEPKDPCADDADGLSPATLPLPARILSTETNADGSASARVLDVGGGEGDPGRLSILGADADCDGNSDAWVLLIQDGDGADVLRLDSDTLPDLSPDGTSGVFWTIEESGHAQAVVLTGDPGSLRIAEAEACDE